MTEDLSEPARHDVGTTSLRGADVLAAPLLNKGSAFPRDERVALGLGGLLPYAVATLEEQCARAYAQFRAQPTALAGHAFLTSLHDQNEVLFYRLLLDHLEEVLPIVYTPTTGVAIEAYSHQFRRPRGLFLAKPDEGRLDELVADWPADEVDVIVATDGEAILGIGDQGVGGIGISIAKLVLYSLCGGIHPARTLPVMLDVGTDRRSLLDDPLYLGWRHERVRGPEYDSFVDAAVAALRRRYPDAFLHWEDLGVTNARRLLERLRPDQCTFNDDMQGTGVVTLATVRAAVVAAGSTLSEQRVLVFGAGTAGTGIADQVHAALVRDGLGEDAARRRIWAVDRDGLLLAEHGERLTPAQRPYARSAAEVSALTRSGPGGEITLADVVAGWHPTILIGTSAQHGAFGEDVVRELAAHVERPIVLPLSNPNRLAEADPNDVLRWSEGRALVASGSPFPAQDDDDGRSRRIGECNNAFAFPGIGLGVVVSRASRLSDGMLAAAVDALAATSPALVDSREPLLPPLGSVREVSARVAAAVVAAAEREGLARAPAGGDALERVRAAMWQPRYAPLRPAAR